MYYGQKIFEVLFLCRPRVSITPKLLILTVGVNPFNSPIENSHIMFSHNLQGLIDFVHDGRLLSWFGQFT